MNTPWKDTSIFCGIRQYFDDFGNEWRQIYTGCQIAFYLEKDNAFIHQGNGSPRHKNASIYMAHKLFLEGREYEKDN